MNRYRQRHPDHAKAAAKSRHDGGATEELSEAAREQYVASRLKREQIRRVFDDIAARLEIEEGRRLQAASDDRFLARRRWTDAREKTRDKQQMKAS